MYRFWNFVGHKIEYKIEQLYNNPSLINRLLFLRYSEIHTRVCI